MPHAACALAQNDAGTAVSQEISIRYATRLPVALAIGAIVYAAVGPGLVERLTDYGFGWSRNPIQDLSLLVAWLVWAPAGYIVESDELPRWLFAINGALWGAVWYSAWTLMLVACRSMSRSAGKSREQ